MQLQVQNTEFAPGQYLEDLIGRSKTTLTAISEVLTIVLGNQSRLPVSQDAKFLWKVWLKSQGQLDKLFLNLRDVRRDISNACTLLTA